MSHVTQAAPAPQRQDFTVHGTSDGAPATIKVSATGQTAAIRISGVERHGARAHASWFDCRTCHRAVAEVAAGVTR
jgi:hypothetical protein